MHRFVLHAEHLCKPIAIYASCRISPATIQRVSEKLCLTAIFIENPSEIGLLHSPATDIVPIDQSFCTSPTELCPTDKQCQNQYYPICTEIIDNRFELVDSPCRLRWKNCNDNRRSEFYSIFQFNFSASLSLLLLFSRRCIQSGQHKYVPNDHTTEMS